MAINIIGLFSKTSQAGAAIKALEIDGVASHKISMLTSEHIDKSSFEITENTRLPETAAAGAAAGGTLGLIVGGLTAVGSVATGGIGLLASGPIIASLTGGALGAYGGGIIGAVLGTATPNSEHQVFLDELEKGGVLVCVECQPETQKQTINLLKSVSAARVEVSKSKELEELKGN